MKTNVYELTDALKSPPELEYRGDNAMRTMDSRNEPRRVLEAIWRRIQRMLRLPRVLRPRSAPPPATRSSQLPTDAEVARSITSDREIELPHPDTPFHQPYPSEDEQRTVLLDMRASGNAVDLASERAPALTGESPPAGAEPDARFQPRSSAPGDNDTPPDEKLFEVPAITPEEEPAAEPPAVIIAPVVQECEQPLSISPVGEPNPDALATHLIKVSPLLPTLAAACSREIAEFSKIAVAQANGSSVAALAGEIAAPNAYPSDPTPPEEHDQGASPPTHPPSAPANEAGGSHLTTLPGVNGPAAAPLDLEPRPASKYVPRFGRPSATIRPVRPLRHESSPGPSALGSLDAELVMSFNPGQWGITLSFLLRRRAAMPEEITVHLGPDRYDLCAIAEDLFEPVAVAQSTVALTQGLAAESLADPPARWVRSGRSLHVFAARAGVAGFVSTPRVVVGQENAALCVKELGAEVVRLCAATGGTEPLEVFGPGVPAGWRCFRRIQPKIPAAPEACEDLLLALVPLPHAVIDLNGGVSVNRSAWLSGHPPAIRILGVVAEPGEVIIDGQPASSGETGNWVAADWDMDGSHTVVFGGLSRAYEIKRAPKSWKSWEAHVANGLALCGALATGHTGHPVFTSGAGSVWLVGRVPGEIVQAFHAHAPPIVLATPDFEPVWAIPVHSGKGRRRQLPQLIGRAAQPHARYAGMPKHAVRLWCQVLREAVHNTKPCPDPADEATVELWIQYRQAARALWRRLR